MAIAERRPGQLRGSLDWLKSIARKTKERFPFAGNREEERLRMQVVAKVLDDIKVGGFFTLAKKSVEVRRFHLRLKGQQGQSLDVHLDQDFECRTARLTVKDLRSQGESRRVLQVDHSIKGHRPTWPKEHVKWLNIIDNSLVYYEDEFEIGTGRLFPKEERWQFFQEILATNVDIEATVQESRDVRKATRRYRVLWVREQGDVLLGPIFS